MGFVRAFILLASLAGLSAGASASTVHKVRFAQSAKVLVWSDGKFVGQGTNVSLGRLSEPPAAYLGSGTLQPIEVSFGSQDEAMTIKVASNTAFAIEATTADLAAQISVRVLAHAENAQVRGTTIAHSASQVFFQSEKTARFSGPPSSQTITLELRGPSAAIEGLTVHALDR